jgi:hypothetical protein
VIWDQLDQMKASIPQLGDEQVLDVELDKRTELMPAAENFVRGGYRRSRYAWHFHHLVVLLTMQYRICQTLKISPSAVSSYAEGCKGSFSQSFGPSI